MMLISCGFEEDEDRTAVDQGVGPAAHAPRLLPDQFATSLLQAIRRLFLIKTFHSRGIRYGRHLGRERNHRGSFY